MITHYLVTAIRHLWKYKMQNLIGIAGLSLGLFCFSICFHYYRFLIGTDDCFEKSDRLAIISLEYTPEGSPEKRKVSVSSSDLTEMLRSKELSTVDAFCSIVNTMNRFYSVEGEEQLWELNVLEVDTFYNQLFMPDLSFGNWKAIERITNAVVLSKSVSSRMFGEGVDPVGKKLKLFHKLKSGFSREGISYIVQGVMEDLPQNVSFAFMKTIDILVLNDTEGWIYNERRTSQSNTFTYALLRDGFTPGDLQKELVGAHCTFRAFDRDHIVSAQSAKEETNASSWKTRKNLLLIGVPLFLIGVLNFFYFLVASFWGRMHEYAVRRVNGGSLFRLFGMLWVQAFLLLSVVGLLVFILVELFLPYLNFSIAMGRWPKISLDTLCLQILFYWGILLMVCTLLCLAVVIGWKNLSENKGLSLVSRQGSKHYLRNTMLGVQFFICWIFLACTLGIFFQDRKLQKVLFGTLSPEEKKAIYHVNMDYFFLSPGEKETFVNRIIAFSGVETTSLTASDLMISSNSEMSRGGEGSEPVREMRVKSFAVDSCFFSLLNLPLLSGRLMGKNEMVVNESFVKEEGNVWEAIYYPHFYKVSGVVPDFISTVDPWNKELTLYAFMDFGVPDSLKHLFYPDHLYVKVFPGAEARVQAYIEQELRKIIPENTKLQLSTLAEDISRIRDLEYQLKNIVLFLSVASILITLLGVYSAITFDTVRRQKEIAIRKVHGAKVKEIVFLFVRLYFVLLSISALCAFPLVYLVFKEREQSYTVTFDYGFLFWLLVFSLVLMMTAFTVFFKIRRIARINPAEIIRSE